MFQAIILIAGLGKLGGKNQSSQAKNDIEMGPTGKTGEIRAC